MYLIRDKDGNVYTHNMNREISLTTKGERIKDMTMPVVCNHCGEIYDLMSVKVNHWYKDCSQFTTPCCNYKFADTREWKSFPDYRKL